MGSEPPVAKAPKQDPQAEMSFIDHLEELRMRILKGLIGIAIGVIIAFIFSDFIIKNVLLGPVSKDFIVYKWLGIDAIDITLQSRKLPGQFFTFWGTLFMVGIIMGAPLFFHQIWKFVTPALESTEKHKTQFVVFFISFLFLVGVSFGYFILTPFALQFFTHFQISDLVRNDFDINEYFSSLTMWVLSTGIIFQLPMVSYFLSRIGLLTPVFMRSYRRHAIVIFFILGAFLTPPDPISQVMVAVPLILLYEISISISGYANKKRNKEIWGKSESPIEQK
ncbi:MAG: twin-arginine translocase subunit TatC [Bacteroidetes bacterium]|nr:twin-arginine translocase subunit TatC [Bacteroidota bacterium]